MFLNKLEQEPDVENKQHLPVQKQAENGAANTPKSKENPESRETGAKDVIKYVSNLSWRQMNCFDRCLALLLGEVNSGLVNYFKLFLGARYGYNIGAFMTANFQREWSLENEMHLDIFGLRRKFIQFDNISNLQEMIMESIDIYGSAIVRLDEYYLYYTPHYRSGHTNHLTVIRGYDRDKQRYSITGSDHIAENYDRDKIQFGNFFTTFGIIQDTYTHRPEAEWFFTTLDQVDDRQILTTAELKPISIKLLDYLAKNAQSGNDIGIIRDILERKRALLDADNLQSLYRILGGKELFLGTLLDYFAMKNADLSYPREFANKVIGLSNDLINSYLMASYRKRELKMESTVNLMNDIQAYSTKFYQEMLPVFDASHT